MTTGYELGPGKDFINRLSRVRGFKKRRL